MANKPAKAMQPRKTYQFRLYPTHRQITVLMQWLGLCCDVYNAALDERKSAYRMAGVSLSYAHQCAELLECKEVRPELCEVPAQVLQDVVKRVDRAYDDYFRRVEEGQKPGIRALNPVSAMIPSRSNNMGIVSMCWREARSTRESSCSPNWGMLRW